jgi:hypothetical protein
MNIKPEATKYLNIDNAENRHRCAIRIMYGKERLTDVRKYLKRWRPNTNQNIRCSPQSTATWICTDLGLLKNPPTPSSSVWMRRLLRQSEHQQL